MRFVTLLLSLTVFVPAVRAAVPSLVVTDETGAVALSLESLQVRVLVRGHLARTAFEFTYRNHLSRDLDGDFSFPLPPGAEVSDLGLYFGDQLRHAVAVERVQARSAYEETVHRRVDPALAEWSSSTQAFHFRVYPIPASGTKAVYIAYDQELTSADYQLDLRYGVRLRNFSLSVDADAEVESEGIRLNRAGTGWAASGTDAEVNGFIRARRRHHDLGLVAWFPVDRLWYVSTPVEVESSAGGANASPHVVVLYDASGSAADTDHDKLRDFMRRFLARQQPSVRVTVIPFHTAVERGRETGPAGFDAVLHEFVPAGATNLVELLERLPRIGRRTDADARIILITDGLESLSNSRRLHAAIRRLADLERPLTIVNASPSHDEKVLGQLARITRGWFVDLHSLNVAEAVDSAMRLPTSLTFTSPRVRELLPYLVQVSATQTVVINGRSRERIDELPLTAGARHLLAVRELSTDTERDLVRRAWARARLRELLDSGASSKALLEHGRAFNQITPRTSLLILDSAQDYERYGIPLPPDLKAQKTAEERRRTLRRPPGSITVLPPDATSAGRPGWSVSGFVTETRGAFLPGVAVAVTVDGTHTLTSVTDANGRFSVSLASAPASVSVKAELAGFRTVVQDLGAVPAGAELDIVLSFAAVAEQITVTAEAPLLSLRSSRASISEQISVAAAANEFAQVTFSRKRPTFRRRNETSASEEQVRNALAELRSLTSPDEQLRYYVSARSSFAGNKLFHAEAALAIRESSPQLAARVLTDLAEEHADDAATLRLLARVLDGWGRSDLARPVLDRARELAPGETEEVLARHDRGRNLNGLRVELMWDSNYTDVDLHVVEPGGEEVSYANPKSRYGGVLYEDVTTGFGPEVYTLPRVRRGVYRVLLEFFAPDTTRSSMETFAYVRVYLAGERTDYFVTLTKHGERKVIADIWR